MFCEKCGAKLSDDSKFCESCGSAVISAATEEAVPAPADAPIEATTDKATSVFCEKCGAKLPEDGQFCEACGQKVGAAIVAAPVAAAPSAASIALKKFFSNKRNVAIFAGALALLLVVIVVIVIIASLPPKPKTIYLDDYFTVSYEGADGYASAEISWDYSKLSELNNEIFSLEDFDSYDEFLASTDGKYTDYDITDYLDISLSKEDYLSNGDAVDLLLSFTRYEYTDDFTSDLIDASDFKEDFNVILKLRNETITVENLTPVVAFDPFEHIIVNYVGIDGYGEMEIVVPEDAVFTSLSSKSFRFNAYSGGFEVVLYINDSYTFSVSYYCDDTWELANGDTVTFEVSSYFDPSSQQQLASYGFSLAKLSTTKTVSGLTPVLTYNPADNMSANFSGYDTLGTLENGFKEDSVTVGRYTLVFSDDSSSYRRRIHIAIVDENGDTLDSLTYTADTYYDLSNGDTVTFETYEYLDSMKENYGILFPESYTFTVEGLKELITTDPRDYVTYNFSGTSGSITMQMVLKETSYTVGDYTVTLATSYEESWGYGYAFLNYTITDKDGNNVGSGSYRTDATGLSEGDTLYVNPYNTDFDAIVAACGIQFNTDSKTTIVSAK